MTYRLGLAGAGLARDDADLVARERLHRGQRALRRGVDVRERDRRGLGQELLLKPVREHPGVLVGVARDQDVANRGEDHLFVVVVVVVGGIDQNMQ